MFRARVATQLLAWTFGAATLTACELPKPEAAIHQGGDETSKEAPPATTRPAAAPRPAAEGMGRTYD